MTRPDWCPADVWEAVEQAGEVIYGRHERGFVMWPLFNSIPLREGFARAINLRLGGIETPLMLGDNLAVTLCSHFDDGEPSDDDTGWSAAAIAGYEEVTSAICSHYTSAIRGTP